MSKNSISAQRNEHSITQEQPVILLKIIPDRRIISLSNFRIKPITSDAFSSPNILRIDYKLIKDISSKGDNLYVKNESFIPNKYTTLPNVALLLTEDEIQDYEYLEVKVEFPSDFELKFDSSNIDLRVMLSNSDFETHLSLQHNTRILFSSPFGQGKTTFLNEFFATNFAKYKVIKINPVNYSISSNDDVFKYIKCEILYQLLERTNEFDKETWNWRTTHPEFLVLHPEKVFLSFFKSLGAIGKDWYSVSPKIEAIIKTLEAFTKTHKEYKKYHKQQQVDDRKLSENFILNFYDQEGGIFEGNIYTQIIRQLLERLSKRNDPPAKTVLLIDDLDRMDPEHIFRILNIFSAHFDNHIYQEQGLANKFGFDKVVIVCDLENIRNIYAHKYGEKCDFSGYINKYYSITPFNYDNRLAFLNYLDSFDHPRPDNSPFPLLKIIIKDLVLCNEFSIRNMKSFRSIDLSLILAGGSAKAYREFNNRGSNITNALFIVIYYLRQFFEPEDLKRKLKSCGSLKKEEHLMNEYDTCCKRYGFNALVEPPIKNMFRNEEQRPYNYNGKNLTVHFQETRGGSSNFLYHTSNKIEVEPVEAINFTNNDFYNLLILNVDKYIQMGGLKGIPETR